MTLYSCNEINQLIARYFEIQEVALNEWSSTHTVRTYKNCPKKYQTMIDKMEDAV